jgi:hypothetical protein
MRTLEKIKKDYFFSCNEKNIDAEERKEYNITEDTLKKWRTEYSLNCRKIMYDYIMKFNNIEEEDYYTGLIFENIYMYFAAFSTDFMTEEVIYDDIPSLFKLMYENDYFDIFTYNIRAQLAMADVRSKPGFGDIVIKLYDGRDYTGIIPNLYYSNHPDILDKVLKYFCNVVYQKYGLYLQRTMKVLIEFFNKYDQKYVQLLLDSKESAKKLDYPSNHKFKYCYGRLIEFKWE